ncbi:hypothetical protein ACROHD_20200, partial [Nioella aestuarii]
MADPNTTPQETDEAQDDAALAEAVTEADDTVTDAEVVEEAHAVEETAATEPDPQPATAEPRRGPGFVPLVLGGVVAAGLGYGAAFMGFAPTPQDNGATEAALAAIQISLDEQADTLTALTTRATALEGQVEAIPPASEPVDLGPLSEQIAALGARIDATGSQITGLTDRIAYLETLPLGEGGEGTDNSAAVAAAVAQMQAALQEQSASLAEQQAANAAMAEQLAAAATA